MRNGIPTTKQPFEPESYYIECLFHEWAYGPFKTEDDVISAIIHLDEVDSYWDYDCFSLWKGDKVFLTDSDLWKRVRDVRTPVES